MKAPCPLLRHEAGCPGNLGTEHFVTAIFITNGGGYVVRTEWHSANGKFKTLGQTRARYFGNDFAAAQRFAEKRFDTERRLTSDGSAREVYLVLSDPWQKLRDRVNALESKAATA